MFRVVRLCRGVSPFSIFLMDQKNNPALQGYSINKRAKVLSKMYNELPQKQRKDLQQRAQKHPSLNHKKKSPNGSKSQFSRFVKENYDKVKGLNYTKRFSALSQLYELQKPVELSKELRKMGVDPDTVNVSALVKPTIVTVPKSVTGSKSAKVNPARTMIKRAAAKQTTKKAKK